MLGLSARALGYYAAFAYPLALLCAIPYFVDPPNPSDRTFVDRRLRTARLLCVLAPLHIMFPVTALGIVRDLGRAGDPRALARARVLGIAGVTASIVMLVLVGRAG